MSAAYGASPGDLAAVVTMGGAYLVLFAVAEALRWAARVPPGATRALAHVGGGLLALLVPLLFRSVWPVLALAAGCIGLLAAAERRGLLRAVHNAPERRAGVYLYPVALAAVYAFAGDDRPAYATAVLALACGDAAAGAIGRRYGRRRYAVPGGKGQHKSLEGSAAALAVTLATTLVCLGSAGSGPDAMWRAAGAAACVALACTLVEAISPWGTDNLSVPLAALAAVAGVRALGVLGAAGVASGALGVAGG